MRTRQTLNIIALLFVVILLLPRFAFALQDFDAGSDFSGELSQCESQKSSFILTNTGDEELALSLSVSGRLADFVSLSADSVVLPQGQSKEVFFAVDVPCNAKQGAQSLKIVVASDTVKKVLDIPVVIQKPLNVDIIGNVFSQQIPPCTPAVFNVSVVNTGTFADTYSFDLSPLSGALISPDNVVLSAGEKKDILVSFTPDDCSLFGEFPQVFSAVSEKTGVKASLDLDLQIDSADVLTISKGVNKILVNHSISAAKIFVKNEGDKNASYKLSIDGPDWVRVDSANIDVAANSDAGFVLLLSPDESVKSSDYPVVISAASKISDRVYSKTVVVRVSDNNLFGRVLQKFSFSSFRSVGSFLYSEKYYSYGVAAVVFLVALVAFLIRFVRKNNVRQESAQSDTGEDFYADLPEKSKEKADAAARKLIEKELRKEFNFVPKSAVVSLSLWSNWIVRLVIIAVIAGLVAAGYVFRNFFAIYLDYVVLGVIILLVLFVFKRIFNKFVVSKTFGFLLAGDSAEFSTCWRNGLLKIVLKVVDNIEHLRVSVKNGLKGSVLPPSDFVCSSCRVSANCDNSLFDGVVLTFKIKKSVMSRLCAAEKDLRVVFFNENKWRNLDFEVKSSDDKFVYLEAFAETCGFFAVTCKNRVQLAPQPVVQTVEPVVQKATAVKIEKSEKTTVKKSVNAKSSKKDKSNVKTKVFAYFVLFILLASVIGAFVYLSRLQPPAPMPVAGIAPQVWAQDSVHTLNLSKFFHDPDGDVLLFGAKPVENIKIEFVDGIATFTPDAGWFGTRLTVFTVTDPENASASSNDVSLVVNKQFVPASIQPHLPQIIGGVLFVLVVIILLVFRDQIIKFLDDEED